MSIASVFGANMGDFVARYLHLGHAGGLLPLAAILAVVFVAERRDRSPHQWYYWLAIIIVRTAPRPRNLWFSSSAITSASAALTRTIVTVICTEVKTA